MKIVISPAKSLDYEHELPISEGDFKSLIPMLKKPPFLAESKQLIDLLKNFSVDEVGKLMSISPKLAELNLLRYYQWSTSFPPVIKPEVRPAIYAFTGDVYQGIGIGNYSFDEVTKLEERLIILSGLYGYLTPLTLMRPYRLEMGTKLANAEGKDLYQFWGNKVSAALEKMLDGGVLVNLASAEYFKVLKSFRKQHSDKIICPVFKDEVKGEYKVVSFYAKKARGLMTSFLISEGVDQPSGIRDFNLEGYRYVVSDEMTPTFHRNHKKVGKDTLEKFL